jgi:hypothetical protein
VRGDWSLSSVISVLESKLEEMKRRLRERDLSH